ncbi:MAG: tRNA (adenosine(37)-N6)-threonylcarbamoyltransferase complex dimerization subunit type 1 TsaB [Gemmatimonadetes bacterium]|nr:tRNA (adenosine(37)-N6)-threonylcarbamoyltransferase complex dimerization subunit type 1 TsaB [Gemmatimonadota bacterium]
MTTDAVERPLLALDTSTRLGSVAVGSPLRVRAELTIGASARRSESLLPAIDLAMKQASVERDALHGVIVGAGPGSFTGVRIAAATAKAIAAALRIPLFAHSSLAMLAAGAAAPGRTVCALFDARRGEVYGACYRFDPRNDGRGAIEMITVMAPVAEPVDVLIERLATHAPLWVGEGALRFAGRLHTAGRVAPAALAVPHASSLFWLHQLDPAADRVADLARWSPAYVRAPGATPHVSRLARTESTMPRSDAAEPAGSRERRAHRT